MDEVVANIFRQSERLLSKLQLLTVFFDEEIIYKIYLRTQVIHQLFEQNPELDAHKLELFHLQFTESVMSLLRSIKKTNERNVSLLFDEIRLNKDLIGKLDDFVDDEKTFRLDQQRQSLKINQSLRRLYAVLSDHSTEFPFSKSMHAFSLRYSADFYQSISPELLAELTAYSEVEVYTNEYAVIERKLMGMLCKYDFKTEFYCGVKAGTVIVEIYQFTGRDIWFLYLPSRNLFLFCDVDQLSESGSTEGHSKKENIIKELVEKNEQLESRASLVKTHIPEDVKTLLTENYKKIADVDFLRNTANFDIEANILKAMLNTDAL